jgi:hypothetical protein
MVRAMVLAPGSRRQGKLLFAADPVERKETDPDALAPHLGEALRQLRVLSARNGKPPAEIGLPAQPVFHGMAAAAGKLFLALADGQLICLGSAQSE